MGRVGSAELKFSVLWMEFKEWGEEELFYHLDQDFCPAITR